MGITCADPPFGLVPRPIDVRITSDGKGQTLSLCDNNYMLMIPLEAVADMLTAVDGVKAAIQKNKLLAELSAFASRKGWKQDDFPEAGDTLVNVEDVW